MRLAVVMLAAGFVAATGACADSSRTPPAGVNDAAVSGSDAASPGSDAGLISDSGSGSQDSSGGTDSALPNQDAGGRTDAGGQTSDASGPNDAGMIGCQRDQEDCPVGQVCNLALNPPQCVVGVACQTDLDCDACASIGSTATDCGHGFHVVAFCDDRHGNVCTRSRAPCEPCFEDRDCGRQHPLLGGAPSACLDYGNNEKFCGRACGSCPYGFFCDALSNQCRADDCAPEPVICPPDNMTGAECSGTDQICPGEECPNTGGAQCATNNQPYSLGICIGYCTSDTDCPAATPTCNRRNGICF